MKKQLDKDDDDYFDDDDGEEEEGRGGRGWCYDVAVDEVLVQLAWFRTNALDQQLGYEWFRRLTCRHAEANSQAFGNPQA